MHVLVALTFLGAMAASQQTASLNALLSGRQSYVRWTHLRNASNTAKQPEGDWLFPYSQAGMGYIQCSSPPFKSFMGRTAQQMQVKLQLTIYRMGIKYSQTLELALPNGQVLVDSETRWQVNVTHKSMYFYTVQTLTQQRQMQVTLNSTHLTVGDSSDTFVIHKQNSYWSLYILVCVITGTVYLWKKQPRRGHSQLPEDIVLLRLLFGAKITSLAAMATLTAPCVLWLYEAIPVCLVMGCLCYIVMISVLKDCCVFNDGRSSNTLIVLQVVLTIAELVMYGNWLWMISTCLFIIIGKLILKLQRKTTSSKDLVFVRSCLSWLFFQSIHLFLEDNYFRIPPQRQMGGLIVVLTVLLCVLIASPAPNKQTTLLGINLGQCGICLESIVVGNVFLSDCGHNFHLPCLKQWLRNKNMCPIDGAKIKSGEYCPPSS